MKEFSLSASYNRFSAWAVETAFVVVGVVVAFWLMQAVLGLPLYLSVGVAAAFGVPAAWLGRKAGPDFFDNWPAL